MATPISRRNTVARLRLVAVAAAALLLVAACKELPKIQPPSLVVSNPTVALADFLDGRPAAPR